MKTKQVEKTHYDFGAYMSKGRWSSVWHQLHEIMSAHHERVLEIGPGPGILKAAGRAFGVMIETLDIDPELNPDHVAEVTRLPFESREYDVVCAFQMLEHMPFDEAIDAFREMVRVARHRVIISLPDARPVFRYNVYIPGFGDRRIVLKLPFFRGRPHTFDGQHHWEINKRGFELPIIRKRLEEFATLANSYRVFEMPYHRFFVFEKKTSPALEAPLRVAE